ncbi:hypothetical protein LJ721_004725 [Salmonella enterica]|nr:hypothetical protein [Salmonella enterica]
MLEPRQDPFIYGDKKWSELSTPEFKQYAKFRAQGLPPLKAFQSTFGYVIGSPHDDGKDHQRADAIETTEVFRREYEAALKELQTDKDLSAMFLAAKILEMINDDKVSASARAKAMENYSIIMGITEIDDKGQLRKKVDTESSVSKLIEMYADGKAAAESVVISALLSKFGIDPETFDISELFDGNNGQKTH